MAPTAAAPDDLHRCTAAVSLLHSYGILVPGTYIYCHNCISQSGRVRTYATSIILAPYVCTVSQRAIIRVQPKNKYQVQDSFLFILTGERGVSALEGPPPSSRPQERGCRLGLRLSSGRPVLARRDSSPLPSTILRS